MNTGLSAGVAIRDITPTTPQYLHGYSARDGKSLGVREPLSLRCLAVDDGQETILLFCLDMIGVQQHVCRAWYELLERETGIGFPRILISATHTHFAPAVQAAVYSNPGTGLVEPDPAYVALVEAQLVEAAKEALARRVPAVLESVRVAAPGVLFNRRPRRPDGMVATSYLHPLDDSPLVFPAVDDELAVLRFRSEHGFLGRAGQLRLPPRDRHERGRARRAVCLRRLSPLPAQRAGGELALSGALRPRRGRRHGSHQPAGRLPATDRPGAGRQRDSGREALPSRSARPRGRELPLAGCRRHPARRRSRLRGGRLRAFQAGGRI